MTLIGFLIKKNKSLDNCFFTIEKRISVDEWSIAIHNIFQGQVSLRKKLKNTLFVLNKQ